MPVTFNDEQADYLESFMREIQEKVTLLEQHIEMLSRDVLTTRSRIFDDARKELDMSPPAFYPTPWTVPSRTRDFDPEVFKFTSSTEGMSITTSGGTT